jgi:ferredoxin-NADP reductase
MTEFALAGFTPVRWQDATVVARQPQTPNITSFLLRPVVPFQWYAGQHVDIRLTAADGYRAARSYSIASAPNESGVIELAIERLADGEVSPFFHDIAQVGDAVELKGPLGGHFVWRPVDHGPVLLVGAGSGVVPLLAMIRHRASTRAAPPFHLLLSARTSADILYRNELEALAGREDGFSLTLAITREPTPRQSDYSRRIDTAMMRDVLSVFTTPPSRSFMCGTNGFVNAAADGAIAAGIPADTIRTERYGGA